MTCEKNLLSSIREINVTKQDHYYFDGITNIKDHDIDKSLVNEISCQIFFIYRVANKTPYGRKLLHISFNGVEVFIGKRGRYKYLSLFPPDKKYERVFAKIQYLVSQVKKVLFQMFIIKTIGKSELIRIMICLYRKN